YGYFVTGHPSLIEWRTYSPWWLADFLPSLQTEIGMALAWAGTILCYWPPRPLAAVRKRNTTSSKDCRKADPLRRSPTNCGLDAQSGEHSGAENAKKENHANDQKNRACKGRFLGDRINKKECNGHPNLCR